MREEPSADANALSLCRRDRMHPAQELAGARMLLGSAADDRFRSNSGCCQRGSVGFRRTGAIQHATGQGTSSTCQRQCQPTPRTAGIESGPSTSALAGFLSSGDSPAFPSRRMLYSGRSTRRTNRGRETPWTAANRDKEQQKVTIPPTRKPTAETESPSVQADSLRDRSGLVKNLHRMSQSRKGSCVTSAV